jgi:hypothetical protein
MPSRLNNPPDYSVRAIAARGGCAREAVKAEVVGRSDNVSCGSHREELSLRVRPETSGRIA